MSKDEFTAFYAEHKDRCLRAAVASGLAPDRAEDAVAEAFARAWSRWRTVRRTRAPAAWVVRTAVNADISWWRKRRREHLRGQLPESAVPDQFAGSDRAAEVVAAVRRLPPRQREVVILRYLLDLDTAAAAAHLGIAPGTVTAHLHHALATLRAQLTSPEGITS